MYSSDGISWQQTTTGASFSQAGYGVAYGDGKWVAVGYSPEDVYGSILHSEDGISWQQTTEGEGDFIGYGNGVAFKS